MSPLLTLTPAQRERFLIRAVPLHCQLGMRSVSCSEGGMRIDLPWSEALAASAESGLHPGAIATLIDALSGSVVLTRMHDFRRSATLDLRLDFVRPAVRGEPVVGEAEVLHIDGNLAFTRAVAHHGNVTEPVAVSSGCFAVFKGHGGNPLAELEEPLPTFVPWQPTPVNGGASPLQRIFDAVPYSRLMGFEAGLDQGSVTGRQRYGAHLIGNPVMRSLHGGGIASLLQLTAAAQLMARSGASTLPRLFNLNLEFLRQSAPADAYARAEVMSLTRRFANLRVTAYQDDPQQPIAMATVQFVLV